MNEVIVSRLEALRQWMRLHDISAFIFPSTDPHAGEYVPDHWKVREWISGFNGSAGTAVVTLTRAALWTDSRYWLAAEEQLSRTTFEVMRCSRNVATADELAEWISSEEGLPPPLGGVRGGLVGIDGWCVSHSFARSLVKAMQTHGLKLRQDVEPASQLWKDRPALPVNPIEIQPIEYAGETATSKLQRIREAMHALGANATVITQLDDIAWTLNLRGTDVHCTPLFVSYLLLLPDKTVLCVDPQKVTAAVQQYLDSIDVCTQPYSSIASLLAQNSKQPGLRFLVDPSTTNSAICDKIYLSGDEAVATTVIEGECPVTQMKAVKNDTEIAGYRSAMLKDGVAMVKFLKTLSQLTRQPLLPLGGGWEGASLASLDITEMGVDKLLTSLRAEQEGFRDISFDTIAGYGAHAAIVHYEATPDTDIPLERHGLLLLDSGAQYQDGTTDITRTIPLGPLTEDERRDYTLVLKGFLRLCMAVFPDGTTGTQLDVLARYAMWQEHKNYGHGTGHGVGSYLSVHEGPHQFRMNYVPAPLHAGMTVTVEPGIYIAGSHGVRIENTMLIVLDGEEGTTSSQWLRLEPLTLCPIDTTPIICDMMLPDEIGYLNRYHARVREALLPLLNDEDDRQWLIEATAPLSFKL